VVARSQSPSLPADPERSAFALLLALVVMIGTWNVLHRGFYRHAHIEDTPIYFHYGNAIPDGKVPYRDFGVEYPPGALPIFAIPSLGHAPSSFTTYRRIFETLMWLSAAVALVCMSFVLGAVGAGSRRTTVALLFAALAPLALGSVVLSRFDLWPAALAVGGLAALVNGRPRLGLGVLGAGLATKLWPAVLVPFALVYVWRRRGRRVALASAGVFVLVVAAFVVPFLVLAPHGLWESVWGQLRRPLQIESLGSGFLLAAHHAFGLDITMRSSHGSQNLDGSLPDALALVQTGLQLAVLTGLWIAFARSPRSTPEGLVRYSAAAVAAFVAFGKVLSPQFLIWLIPFVPLVRGRRGVAASALFGVACVLTQLWFPFRYWDLVREFATFPSWLVPVRDLVLVALVAVLAWPRSVRPRKTARPVVSDGRAG
jgi:Glycosyltransferase family 87